MAHQDYVSRPRSSKKKKNPYTKKTKKTGNTNNNQGLDIKVKFIGLMTIALIAGASYFLWSIKDVQPTVEPINTELKTSTKNNDNNTTLPELPKVKWTYIDQLKTKKVDVGEYEVKEGGPYQMQCGSFRTKAQAERLKATIAFTGIESQIRQVKGTSGMWYKVILGPYTLKRSAEKDKHQLSRNKINYCQIWSWR